MRRSSFVGMDMPRSAIVALVAIVALLWASWGTSGATETIDDRFIVHYEPETFYLKPDEDATVVLDIENIADETWSVALRFSFRESGFTRGEIHPSLIVLKANTSHRVTVSFRTNAKYGQEPGSSDFKITLFWGHDLVRNDMGWVDDDMIEGRSSIVIPVQDDLTDQEIFYRNVVYSAIIVIVFIVAVVLVVLRTKKRDDGL